MNNTTDSLFASPERKRRYNKKLFTVVAPRYDLITRLLSLGRDASWKRSFIRALPDLQHPRCLDLASGSGDLTRGLALRYPSAHVVGIDLTDAMVRQARAKTTMHNVFFEQGDMCILAYDDASIDCVTGGYALRNAPDLSCVLREVHRVLRPGGTFAFLDFSKSPSRFMQFLMFPMLKGWGMFWGLLVHGRPSVYGYIADSLRHFPDRLTLRTLLEKHGFTLVVSRRYMCGFIEYCICTKR